MLDNLWRLFQKEGEENKGRVGAMRRDLVDECLMSPSGLSCDPAVEGQVGS